MEWSNVTVTQKIELWIPIAFFVMLWCLMQWHEKLPSTKSIQHFISIINSRGGNIAVLFGLSVYFFKWSMYIFFDLLSKISNGKIDASNAIALMAIQFATSSAFGGSMGAMLKTMTGESSATRSTDPGNLPPGTTMASTTKTDVNTIIPSTNKDVPPQGTETAGTTGVEASPAV